MIDIYDSNELRNIKGVGNITFNSLQNENINNINDLLHYFPKNYSVYEENKEEIFSGNYVIIKGEIKDNPVFIKYNKSNAIIFYLSINDKKYKFIYFSGDYIRYVIKNNMIISLYAKYIKNKNEFSVKKIFLDEISTKVECDYKIKGIKDHVIKKIISNIYLDDIKFEETLPLDLINKYHLLEINDYIYKSHLPINGKDVKEVLRRRKYEEFFWYSTKLDLINKSRELIIKPLRSINYNLVNTFLSDLEFELTPDQKKVIKEIENDILSKKVMNRLVQGDVGCGKSIISLYTALLLVSSGYQVAIMLPTEILANQQYELIKKYFDRYGIITELLTSSIISKKKEDILYRLLNNRINILVGTHSLIEDKVIFNRLGLVIIDEQHKFGVMQRQKLINKFKNVDALYLTATPIPRSLGLTIFGDLDLSSIHTMPSERIKVETKIWPYDKIKGLMKSIDNELSLKHQVYIVVPKVLENDTDTISITDAYNLFSEGLNNARIGLCHGKMKNEDKAKAMNDFYNGITNVLISTTVVEVGMNVKNATVMVIMDSNMFGLSQLHQLRGRVGRSNLKSYCILLTNDVLNDRLLVIENETDGFKISEEDFKLRGPGSYIGNDQSGYFDLMYSSFEEDFKIFDCARNDSHIYIDKFLKKEIKSNIFNDIIKSSKLFNGKNN